jgi:hypothetical protein
MAISPAAVANSQSAIYASLCDEHANSRSVQDFQLAPLLYMGGRYA